METLLPVDGDKCDDEGSNRKFGEALMRIISYGRIREFYELHPESQVSLDAWYDIAADANWKTFAEVRRTFRSADVYGTCTIFDVGNNKYRLIAWMSYKNHKVFIRSVMTHAEYDKDKWKSDCQKSKS